MKISHKLLLLLLTIFAVYYPKTSKAQCGTVMVNATVLYYPDTIANLPTATNGASYTGVLQFFVPATISGVPITSVTVNSISGLPASFSSAYSPVSGTVLANNSGCIIFTSTLVNEVVGTYPIVINVTAVSPFGTFPQALTGYKIPVVNPANPNNSYTTINSSICNGNTYNFGNISLGTSGTYADTLPNYKGGDSIITLHLTVNNNTSKIINDSICQGDNYTFGTNIYSTAGTYVNHLTNYVGCDSMITLNLSVNPTPSVPSISHNNCVLTCDTLAAAYQWYLAGAIIPSATSQTYTMPANGLYAVQITNTNGCSRMSIQNYYTCALGINETPTTQWMQVAPSPFQNEITVIIDKQIKKGVIDVLNTIGQVVKAQKFESATAQKIDLSFLEDGIYYLQLKSNESTQTIKIVKSN